MAIWKAVQAAIALGVSFSVLACTGKPIANGRLLALAADDGTVCDLNESATAGTGTYSANVDLAE